MGHWILEVSKFAMYISLPLSSFVVFNNPSFYTDVIYDWRKRTDKFAFNDQVLKQMQDDAKEVAKLHEQHMESLNKTKAS